MWKSLGRDSKTDFTQFTKPQSWTEQMNIKSLAESQVKKEFQEQIIEFYLEHGRRFPWRRTRDPFRILVAEILLRLTGAWKVEAVYEKVIAKYGDVEAMSRADVSELEEMIRPLGLLSRAKVLVNISQNIVNRFNGKIPNDLTKLMSLKGVGRYTANAILCMAYGARVPLVDESVKRVFTRCLHFESNRSAYLDDNLWVFAAELLPEKRTREYNLGLLDLGAMLCRYQVSSCDNCPLVSVKKLEAQFKSSTGKHHERGRLLHKNNKRVNTEKTSRCFSYLLG